MKENIRLVREMLASLPDPSDQSIEERRKGMDDLMEAMPLPEGTTYEKVAVGGVPAEWVICGEVDRGSVILYLHGGGYVMGSPVSHRRLVALISRAACCPVLVPDYRLAPEHPFPAALEDALVGYRWLTEKGFRSHEIAIAGDSAGGGLAAATLAALRDAGDPLPSCGVLISPWADLTCSSDTYESKATTDPMVAREIISAMADQYLAGQDPATPLASPVFANLAGLPPLLIQVGSEEVLLGDSLALEERAKACDVDCTLEVWQDMIHVWHFFSAILEDARKAIDGVGEFCRVHRGR